MAKKKFSAPKVGDKVNFVFTDKHIICPATVTEVPAEHEGRLIHIEAITPDGSKPFRDVCFDEVGNGIELHGHSWHWVEEEK